MEHPAVRLGQDDLLVRTAQNVRGLSHEVYAAEDDVLGALLRGGKLGQLEGVALEVGEPYHLVSLVVMSEYDKPVRQFRARLEDPEIELIRRHSHVFDRQLLPADAHGELVSQGFGHQIVVVRAKR